MTFNPIEEKLLRKILSRYPDEFTASNLTHDKACGFNYVGELVPVLDKLVEDGKLFKGSRHNHYHVTNPITGEYHTSVEESFNEDDFSEDYCSELKEIVKKYTKFIITTAVVDKPVNDNFLKSIKNYAERNNALVLILPSDIHNKKDNSDKKAINLDPKLKDFKIVYKDTYLNKNLCICSIKTSAKQIKTLTGLDRIATKKDASLIVASTKLFEDNVPNKKGKVPFRIVTTGAITVNNYDTDRYMSKRTAYLAEEDHMYGAVVVEKVNNNLFHMRVIEGSKNDTLTDLGIEYNSDGTTTKLKDSVVVFGDSHTEKLNRDLHRPLMDILDDLNIETVVLHDVFNGTSITHHDKGKALTRAIKANEHKISLEQEGIILRDYLNDIKKHVRDVVIVKSNHDRHLDSYLEEGRYINDPINTYIAHKLAIAYMDNKDPLQYLEEDLLGLSPKFFQWLKLDESYERYGVELSFHGSSGVSGARGSLVQFEKALQSSVTAHSHSAKRIRRACCVGTVGELDQIYNRGTLTTWSHTICILYSNGTKQLVHFILDENGNYRYTI